MRRPGEVLSRYQLLEHAWDYEYENRSNVVDVYVRYLREKIDRPVRHRDHRDGARRRLPAPEAAREVIGRLSDPGAADRRVRRGDARWSSRWRALFVYVKVRSDLNEALDESLASRADDVVGAGRGRRGLGAGPRRRAPRRGRGQLRPGAEPGRRASLASTLSAGAGAAITPAEADGRRDGSVCPASARCPASTARRSSSRARSPRPPASRSSWSAPRPRTEARPSPASPAPSRSARRSRSCSPRCSATCWRAARWRRSRRCAAGPPSITLERSGERLPLPRADDEIRRLGETLNEMLDRIEASLERERVFVADASHELRTPLAILRTELELAERPGRSPEELRAALRSAAEEVDRLVAARRGPARDRALRPGAPADQAASRPSSAPLLERVRDRFASRAAEAGREIVGLDARPAPRPSSTRCASSRRSATSSTTRCATARARCASTRSLEGDTRRARGLATRAPASPPAFATAPSSASAAPTRAGPAAAPGSGSRSCARSPRRTAARRRSTAAGPP